MKTILVDAWNTFVTKEGINKEMQAVLDMFSNRKIIVTNANEEQKVTLGIVDMPYEVFSLAHQPDKTDPIYFKKLFEHFSVTADDVVYFEHNKESVQAAESLGIKSYCYDPEIKDIPALKMFLEANV